MALVAMALAIGHALGGPAPDDRTALAMACASRHLGIAVLVAASLPGPRTTVVIVAYVLASAAVTLPYLKWRRKASATTSARQAASSGPCIGPLHRPPSTGRRAGASRATGMPLASTGCLQRAHDERYPHATRTSSRRSTSASPG